MIIPLQFLGEADAKQALRDAIARDGGAIVVALVNDVEVLPTYLDDSGGLSVFEDGDGRGHPKIYKRIGNAERALEALSESDDLDDILALGVALWTHPDAGNALGKYVAMHGATRLPGSTRR